MKPVGLTLCLLAILSLALLLPPAVVATPYWGPEEIDAWLHRSPAGGPTEQPAPAANLLSAQRSHPDYLEALTRSVAFLSTWQVSTPGPDFGGIREAEHLPTIIQTDNTSEAIWVWTRYFELTGDNTYYQNILNAYTYSLLHPAYLEEGGSLATTGYYRMYNCGWAVKAEQKFRDIYGLTSYKQYSDSCASYIRYHTLNRFGSSFYDYVNPPVLAWAMGNLYAAGVHESRQAWMDAAVSQTRDKVKVWVEGQPALLGNETWAMSGGATLWGLLQSYFVAYPESTAAWVPRYIAQMDTFSTAGDFQNAWNGWYAYGHRYVGLALDDSVHLAIHTALTDTLVAEDRDLDGGIPAKHEEADSLDQTWVANYRACMGLSEFLLPDPASAPALTVQTTTLPDLASAPNPFHRTAHVTFCLPRPEEIRLSVHDVSGRCVALLTSGPSTIGRHELEWDGRTQAGAKAPAGVYFVTLVTPDGKVSRPVILTR